MFHSYFDIKVIILFKMGFNETIMIEITNDIKETDTFALFPSTVFYAKFKPIIIEKQAPREIIVKKK